MVTVITASQAGVPRYSRYIRRSSIKENPTDAASPSRSRCSKHHRALEHTMLKSAQPLPDPTSTNHRRQPLERGGQNSPTPLSLTRMNAGDGQNSPTPLFGAGTSGSGDNGQILPSPPWERGGDGQNFPNPLFGRNALLGEDSGLTCVYCHGFFLVSSSLAREKRAKNHRV